MMLILVRNQLFWVSNLDNQFIFIDNRLMTSLHVKKRRSKALSCFKSCYKRTQLYNNEKSLFDEWNTEKIKASLTFYIHSFPQKLQLLLSLSYPVKGTWYCCRSWCLRHVACLVQFLWSEDIQCYAPIRVPCFLVPGSSRSPYCKCFTLMAVPVRASSMVPLSCLVSSAKQICGRSPYFPFGRDICVKVTFFLKLTGFTPMRTENIFLTRTAICRNALEKLFLISCSSNGQKSHRLAKSFVKGGLLREVSSVSIRRINRQCFSWNEETFHICNFLPNTQESNTN